MDEYLPEPKIDELNMSPNEASSPNKGIFKIASAILILLIIYFIYLIYNKL